MVTTKNKKRRKEKEEAVEEEEEEKEEGAWEKETLQILLLCRIVPFHSFL